MKPVLTRRACLSGALGAAAAQSQSPVDLRPNLIVITMDDLGYADLGFTGARDFQTPAIDALLRSGVFCVNGYASHPLDSPTRAGLMTGRYGQRFGHENDPAFNRLDPLAGLPPSETTLGQALLTAGYRTGLIGKWHLGATVEFGPARRGFTESFCFPGAGHDYFQQAGQDEYFAAIERNGKPEKVDGYLTEAFSREANAFIQRSAPFFLHLSYSAPHAPLQAAARFERQAVGIANQSRRRYAAMILAVDEGVGLLARTLRDKNLEHNTMVIFCTTNGGPIDSFYVSSRPFRGGKGELYEGGIHVPFAVSWPGRLAAGAKYYEPVSTLDIFATACGLAGAEIPADRKLDSVNLLPFLEGKSKGAPHERLFWRTGGGDAWAMREGRWKIVRQKDKPVELYDLNTDRGELRDLSPSSAEQIKEMWARVETWNADLVPPIFG